MTKDDIIRMAQEVGLVTRYRSYDDWIDAGPSGQELLEFATLVAAAEREACAKLVESYCGAWDDEGYRLSVAIRKRSNT